MRLARRSVETPEAQRTWWQRFLVALTMGDAGRNGAEVAGCWPLHRIADLERELYGEVVSGEARDHVEGTEDERAAHPRSLLNGCTRHWTVVEYR